MGKASDTVRHPGRPITVAAHAAQMTFDVSLGRGCAAASLLPAWSGICSRMEWKLPVTPPEKRASMARLSKILGQLQLELKELRCFKARRTLEKQDLRHMKKHDDGMAGWWSDCSEVLTPSINRPRFLLCSRISHH